MNNVSNIVKDFESRLKRYVSQIVINMANDIADDLTLEAKNSIVDFYNHYNPSYYTRTGSMKYSYKRYYRNHSSHITAGVELLSSEIPDVYSDPVSEVLDRVYAGFHGYAGVFDNRVYRVVNNKTNKLTGQTKQHTRLVPPRMIPSPMDRILKKRDEIVKNASIYQQNAVSRVTF